MRKILLAFSFSLALCTGFSQEKPGPVKRGTLAIQIGAFDFITPQRIRSSSISSVLGDKGWAKAKEMDLSLGLSYIKGISKHFDYSVNGAFGSVAYPVRNSAGQNRPSSISKLLFEADASIHMKLLPDNYIVVPYLSAGAGGSVWDGRFEAFSPLGGGLQFALGQDHFAFTNFQYRVPLTQGANYHFFTNLGVGLPVGKEKVEEVKPAPIAPVVVPKDTDGDGIIDDEDKCPTVPGIAKYQGCPIPDTDGDGINDEQDKCPTVPGLAKYEGCPIPDTDADGFNDEEDKCPTVPGIAKYQGCPIPDTDGDGINDEMDKCPTVPGIPELMGCPRPAFKPENVLFATGSATLLINSKKELDILVKYLAEHTGVKITIAGHTDNTGNAELNKRLSQKRARSAELYLESKGIEESRIKSEGYGQERPIADNKTAEGRKKNRRVEFTIDE